VARDFEHADGSTDIESTRNQHVTHELQLHAVPQWMFGAVAASVQVDVQLPPPQMMSAVLPHEVGPLHASPHGASIGHARPTP
jgi:hypothetical protein